MALSWRLDWASQVIISTSTVNASATLTTGAQNPFWIMGVSGSPPYLSMGAAAATSADALHAIGSDDTPKLIPGGTIVNAITAFGTGQVWFVRAHPVDLND